MIRSHSDVTQREIHASIFFCFLIILFPTSKHYLPSSHSDSISISVYTNYIYFLLWNFSVPIYNQNVASFDWSYCCFKFYTLGL